MKRKKFEGFAAFGLFIGAVVIAVVMSSCISSPESAIIGTWEEVDGDDVIEFYKDGTFAIDGIGGDYKFIDDTHLKLDLGMQIMIAEVNFQIN